MDNLTKAQRSYNMSRIRSTGTKLEKTFFKLLDDFNIQYIKHPSIFGKPDCQIGTNTLIFIDSDFWHGWHFTKWKNRLPKKYWVEKIQLNIDRDKMKFKKLRISGFNVIRIWEHEMNNLDKIMCKLNKHNLLKSKIGDLIT